MSPVLAGDGLENPGEGLTETTRLPAFTSRPPPRAIAKPVSDADIPLISLLSLVASEGSLLREVYVAEEGVDAEACGACDRPNPVSHRLAVI